MKMVFASIAAVIILAIGFLSGLAAGIAAPPMGPRITIPLPEQPNTGNIIRENTHSDVSTEISRWSYANLGDEIKCLADNMYFEGRNQSIHGKIGIGLTTINRVQNKHFKDNICDVVWYQAVDRRTQKLTAHFSWTLDGKSDKIKNKEAYAEIYRLAEAMLAEGTLDNFHDFTEGSTHYHADYVDPYWSNTMTMVAQIDDHIFYK
jgi:spore germination cell wall hydrolase CwlJ-like protein